MTTYTIFNGKLVVSVLDTIIVVRVFDIFIHAMFSANTCLCNSLCAYYERGARTRFIPFLEIELNSFFILNNEYNFTLHRQFIKRYNNVHQ